MNKKSALDLACECITCMTCPVELTTGTLCREGYLYPTDDEKCKARCRKKQKQYFQKKADAQYNERIYKQADKSDYDNGRKELYKNVNSVINKDKQAIKALTETVEKIKYDAQMYEHNLNGNCIYDLCNEILHYVNNLLHNDNKNKEQECSQIIMTKQKKN